MISAIFKKLIQRLEGDLTEREKVLEGRLFCFLQLSLIRLLSVYIFPSKFSVSCPVFTQKLFEETFVQVKH